MLANVLRHIIALGLLAAPAFAAEHSTPHLSSPGRAALLDDQARLKLDDLSWLTWSHAQDGTKRADWLAMKNWVEFRKSEMTAVMRRKLEALHVDRDLSRLPVACFEDLLCTELDMALKSAERFDDPERLKRALAEVEPVYRTFADLNKIEKRTDKQRLGKDTSFEANIVSLQMRDQAEQQAEHALRRRVSTDGKVLLIPLLRMAWRETTFENTPFLEAHVAKEGWPTISRNDRAATFAWLTAQHADHTPDFQWRMLQLMRPLLDKNEVERRHYVYLYDRVNVNLGLPQRYGTQFHCVNGKLEREPLENPDEVDARLKEMGLPPLIRNIDQDCSAV